MDDLSLTPPVRPPAAAVIPPHGYSDPAVHRREIVRIFQKCWMFVGLTDDLGRDNDFITSEIAGTSVVVQNFAGELRALRNVCTHRHSKIQLLPCGNRKFNCPYHGWAFNRDGALIGVPGNAEYFGFDKADKGKLALKRFDVATRGRFVFVRLSPGGPSLDEFLGDYGQMLDHVSGLFTRSFEQQVMPWAANWKIGVETVLEPYHVNATHPETFKKFIRGLGDTTYNGEHSLGVALLSEASADWWDGVVRRLGTARSETYRNYDHFFIFPNLAVGVTAGAMMSVQTYDPAGPDRTLLRLRLLLSPPSKTGAAGAAVAKAITREIARLNEVVIEEDRIVGEACHVGARQMEEPAALGSIEERITAFHAAWFARMEGA